MRYRDIGGQWAIIVGALLGIGLLAVIAAFTSAATCWD